MVECNREEQTVSQATYLIGRAAEASGVSIKAIRYYEEIGLIPKALRRTNGPHGNGHRVFSVADVGRLKFIRHARFLGLSLAEVRELIAVAEEQGCPESKLEYRAVFKRHLNAINERIDHLLQLRTTIEEFMAGEPSSDSRACTWETCDCMEPADMPESSSAAPDKA
jgi:MerR family gold-responsive transcriptional activator of gol and ges genes